MKVTLGDIAKQTGVTPSTVQRALSGITGVSEAKRAQIRQVAQALGYRGICYTTPVADKALRIAVVFPDFSVGNRYYSTCLWQGIDLFLAHCAHPRLEIVRFMYDRSPEDHADRLRDILEEKHGVFDGVLTRGSLFPSVVETLKKWATCGIPVVLAGTDCQPAYRACCVRNYEEMAGRMAADLLLRFGALATKSKVIVCGNFMGLNQYNNSQGFEKQFWESAIQPDIVKIVSDLDANVLKNSIRNVLDSGLDVRAIYACSARATIPVCDAVREAGYVGSIRLIGSDIFPESAARMKSGEIHALIHNRPTDVARQSIQTLISCLRGEEPAPPDTILLESVIVMRGNLDYYAGSLPLPKDPCMILPTT